MPISRKSDQHDIACDWCQHTRGGPASAATFYPGFPQLADCGRANCRAKSHGYISGCMDGRAEAIHQTMIAVGSLQYPRYTLAMLCKVVSMATKLAAGTMKQVGQA